MFKINFADVFTRKVSKVFIFILLLGLTACADINRVREAQQAFSDAAMQENKLKLSDYSATAGSGLLAQDGAAISTGYTSVILSIDSLASDQVEKLKGDGLWGNVLTLKAMAYWRLGKHLKALEVQKEALVIKGELGDRDRIMMEILPALIDNDEQRSKMNEIEGVMAKGKMEKIKESFVKSMRQIAAKRNQLPNNHPMLNYLLSSELAIYKNIKNVCQRTYKDFNLISCYKPIKCDAYNSYIKLNEALANTGIKNDVMSRWSKITGFSKVDNPCK